MSGIKRRLNVLSESDEGTFMKVAFASCDRKYVDQHFGSAKGFVIYGVNPSEKSLLSVCDFADFSVDKDEEKLPAKLDFLEGCIAVFCRACGASAVKQLLAIGVQPVKVSDGTLIEDLITDLQQELREGPSSWLAKAVTRGNGAKPGFNPQELDGWEE